MNSSRIFMALVWAPATLLSGCLSTPLGIENNRVGEATNRSIQVRVVDVEDYGVPGALVSLCSLNETVVKSPRSVRADERGFVTFPTVPEGRFTVRASGPVCQRPPYPVVAIPSNHTVSLEVTLTPYVQCQLFFTSCGDPASTCGSD